MLDLEVSGRIVEIAVEMSTRIRNGEVRRAHRADDYKESICPPMDGVAQARR